MVIIAKKSYEFSTPNKGKGRLCVKVEPYIMVTVPDWVEKDGMFQAAQKAGNISVIPSKVSIAKDAFDVLAKQATESGVKDPGNMTMDQLQKAVNETSSKEPQTSEESPADGEAAGDNKKAKK